MSRTLISVLCALALAAALCASAARSASPRTPSLETSCVPYIILDSRGSGEPQGTLSPPGQHFVTEWRKLHPGATVIVIKNPYPAAGAFTFLGAVLKAPGGYYKSVVAGKTWLENELVGFAHCGSSTHILLTGYSQGAQVTADVVQAISPPLVLGVALFGDPYFNSADKVDRGGFQAGRNGFLGKRPLFSTYWQPHIRSYCHLHDPVCQGPLHNVAYLFSQHKTYDKLSEPEAAARYFASLETAGSPGHVYWVGSHGTIKRVSVGGGVVTTLASGQGGPDSLAVDDTHVYWTNEDDGTVRSVPLGGGSVTTLASGQGALMSVATDGKYVYWADEYLGTVSEVPVGGGSVTTLASGQNGPFSVAVNGGYIYWVNIGHDTQADGSVNKAPLGGGSVTTLATGQNQPVYVAVDGTHAYWVNDPDYNNQAHGTVSEVPVGGGSVKILATGQSHPFSLAVGGTHAYWGTYVYGGGGTVNKVPLAGGSVTTLASSQNGGYSVAVDGKYVYWISSGGGTVNKAPLGGGSVTTLATGQYQASVLAVGS
jgi:hypothetical protein